MKPLDALSALLSAAHVEQLESRFGRKTREAFEQMHDRGREITDNQETWVMDVAEKMGIVTAPGANLFSRLSPKEQARQRAQARGILPWEK